MYIAGWSSLVARRAHNPEAVGSNPTPATMWSCGVVVNMPACHAGDRGFESRQDRHLIKLNQGLVAQLVEQRIEDPCVGGSNPPWATTPINKDVYVLYFFYLILKKKN